MCSDLATTAVIILCRNEIATIKQVVASLPRGLGDWFVVDNGSDPLCSNFIQKFIPSEHLISIKKPLGVGGAFLEGCKSLKPTIKWICKLDGDGQFNNVAIHQFLMRATACKETLVKTARCNTRGWWIDCQRSKTRHWGNQINNLLVSMASGYYLLQDATSGLFVIQRPALDALIYQGRLKNDYRFESSLIIALGEFGADILELAVPIIYDYSRKRTFSGRSLALPLLLENLVGLFRRMLRNHLLYRLSGGGVLFIIGIGFIGAGLLLSVIASIKAISQGVPTTPGISTGAASLLSWGLISIVGFLTYDFACTFRNYRNKTAFDLWVPIATQGIHATKNHQPKRPS